MIKTQLLIPLSLLIACGESTNDITEKNLSEDSGDNAVLEEGCFVVDDGKGYRWLNDAISVATEGSIITMENCELEHEEKVLIDKSVSIVGSGVDSFLLLGPVNETTITITAPNVSLSQFSIRSTRTSLSIEMADDVTLSQLDITDSGNYAIKATDSYNTTLTDLNLSQNGDGAIQLDGGSAIAENIVLSNNIGVGIALQGSSSFTMNNSIIEQTQPSDPTAISDGFGVIVDDRSALISQGNLYDSNILMNIQALSGSLSLTEDQIMNALSTGVWTEGTASLFITDSTITDNGVYGIVAMGSGGVEASNLNISANPEITPSYHIMEWEDNGMGSMGFFANTPSISVENTEVSGYNNCGANFQSNDADAEIFVDGLYIHDVGRKGLFLFGMDGTVNDLTIENVTDLDLLSSQEPDPETGETPSYTDPSTGDVIDYTSFCYSVDRNIGAVVVSANIDFSNVSVAGIEGYGLSLVQANSSFEGFEAGASTCSSLMAFQSSVSVNNGSWTGNNPYYFNLGASLIGYEANLLEVTNSSFTTDSEEFLSVLAYVRGGDNNIFENNSFIASNYGLYIDDGSVTATNNSFLNQNSYSLYLYGSSTPHSHSLNNNSYQSSPDLSSSSPFYCYNSGNVDMVGDSFTDIYGYYAVRTSDCSIQMEDVSFSNVGGYGIFGLDGDYELDSVEFSDVGHSISASAAFFQASIPMNLSIINSSFSNTGGDGLVLSSTDPENAPLQAILESVTVAQAGDDGISTSNVDVTANNLTINNATNLGISGLSSSILLSNSTIDSSGTDGFYCSDCTMDLSTTLFQNNTGKGMAFSGGSLISEQLISQYNGESGLFANSTDISLEASTFTGNAYYGAEIIGIETSYAPLSILSSDFSGNSKTGLKLDYVTLDIASSTLENNLEYGMQCSNTTTNSCAVSAISGNTLGEQTGCDAACGLEANPN